LRGLETETAGYGLCQWWVLVLPVLNNWALVFLCHEAQFKSRDLRF